MVVQKDLNEGFQNELVGLRLILYKKKQSKTTTQYETCYSMNSYYHTPRRFIEVLVLQVQR